MSERKPEISIPKVTRWEGSEPLVEDSIRTAFSNEDLTPSRWSNGPGDVYAEHSHSYHKVLYCAEGTITFRVDGHELELHPGDRLDIVPGTPHSAVVGPEGVICLEASR